MNKQISLFLILGLITLSTARFGASDSELERIRNQNKSLKEEYQRLTTETNQCKDALASQTGSHTEILLKRRDHQIDVLGDLINENRRLADNIQTLGFELVKCLQEVVKNETIQSHRNQVKVQGPPPVINHGDKTLSKLLANCQYELSQIKKRVSDQILLKRSGRFGFERSFNQSSSLRAALEACRKQLEVEKERQNQ